MIESLIPTRLFEIAVSFYQRVHQAIGMMGLQISRNALWTEPAFVYGEIVSRLYAYDVVLFDKQIHSALHPAIWAMCRHDLVDLSLSAPTAVRSIVKMRSEAVDNAGEIFYF